MVPSADRFTYFRCEGKLMRVVAASRPGGSLFLQWRGDGRILLNAEEWASFEAARKPELLGTGDDDVSLDFSEPWEVEDHR
jgi:hypothetical protein